MVIGWPVRLSVLIMMDISYKFVAERRQYLKLSGDDWVKRDESKYDATNGVSYAIGDTVMLGTGSGLNGKFVYLHSQALNVYLASETSNRGVVIKRILRRKMKELRKYICCWSWKHCKL